MSKAESLEARKAVLLMEQTSHQELKDLDSELPSDTHLVIAEKDFVISMDAVRAFKTVDIFDVYHDLGYKVTSIQNGYGKIKPRLFKNSKGGSK